jgi:phosphatidylglycerophosphatase A
MLKKEDPRTVVIDEAAGQLIALFLLSPQWSLCAASFLLFRFFDIVKPYPIKRVETFPGGFGIMLDDIVAAIFAGIVINLFLLLT